MVYSKLAGDLYHLLEPVILAKIEIVTDNSGNLREDKKFQ